MKIHVITYTGLGQEYDIEVEPSVMIQELKKSANEKAGYSDPEMLWLVFDKEILYDEATLEDYDIQADSTLELLDRTERYRNLNGLIGLKFVDVSDNQALKRIGWSTTAPRWRRARHGLCLEGLCTNNTCEAYNSTVIMPVGYKKVDMLDDSLDKITKCPVCKEHVTPITCGFNNCWWKYDGVQSCRNGPSKQCPGDWRQADDAYYRFNEYQDETITWKKLTLQAAKAGPAEILDKTSENSSKTALDIVPTNVQTMQTVFRPPAVDIAAIPPKNDRYPAANDEADVEQFAQPDKHWCPWKSGSCSNTFKIKGQGTVEIMQRRSVPFELQLSNKKDAYDRSAYSITLSVNQNEVKLSTSTGQSCTSTNTIYTLQPEGEYWHRYWISLFSTARNVKYGIGEVRPSFSVFNIELPENELQLIKEIYYLHFKVNNNDQMLTELNNLKEDFRIFIGGCPVLHELALFIIPQEKYTLEHTTCHTAISELKLERPLRDLYYSVINFKLNTDDFPDLTDVIARSIKNRKGWCYKKLKEKAERFGQPNPKATYLRLTVGEQKGDAPGHNYVVEVWPPGHNSPIHNHSNAYAIIRVLSGEILVRLYPALTLNVNQYKPIEQICHEGRVTWLSPNLNQTHQLKHVDLYGKPCITIQCYMYGRDDRVHYEYFDYLSNDEHSIGHFDPKSDMDFYEFKEQMRQEKQNIFQN
ncbi:unnamed protein product [Adineta steineri]|uniref:Ubiquitin-like domain-containing protein n=1 Tax=Adineta steineri TaxID=433720 RepID=A0A813NAY4_9BILA|nr:unnamed protein product [Adineta steineri]CAF1541164.1 unnamed protein product [Adineta steineri]CAF1541419.1 unnamed protein product [Adineta steineri]